MKKRQVKRFSSKNNLKYLLIEKLKNEIGLEVIAYFAGYGLGPADITNVLDQYRELGVENILVVRGDPPQDDEGFTPHPESLPHASDLMAFIRPQYDFCIGVAGYPEGHNECDSKEKDFIICYRVILDKEQ